MIPTPAPLCGHDDLEGVPGLPDYWTCHGCGAMLRHFKLPSGTSRLEPASDLAAFAPDLAREVAELRAQLEGQKAATREAGALIGKLVPMVDDEMAELRAENERLKLRMTTDELRYAAIVEAETLIGELTAALGECEDELAQRTDLAPAYLMRARAVLRKAQEYRERR